MLAISRRLSSIFRDTILKTSSKLYSTDNDEVKKAIDYPLTEELPPIPPDYGWPGDDNFKSLFEMKQIRESFKYGYILIIFFISINKFNKQQQILIIKKIKQNRNPPKMKRKFIKGPQVMRLLPIQSCSNRKFYRLAVTRLNCDLDDGFIEDLGSIDPMPNKDNQILVALNIERIKYYLSKSVPIKGSVGHILGNKNII